MSGKESCEIWLRILTCTVQSESTCELASSHTDDMVIIQN